VHQVVEHGDAVHGGDEGRRVAEVARDDLHVLGPGHVDELARVTHEDPHGVSGSEEPGHEAPPIYPVAPVTERCSSIGH
jgi:hypothetical protein